MLTLILLALYFALCVLGVYFIFALFVSFTWEFLIVLGVIGVISAIVKAIRR